MRVKFRDKLPSRPIVLFIPRRPVRRRSQRPSRRSRIRQQSLCHSTDPSRLHSPRVRHSRAQSTACAVSPDISELSSERRKRGMPWGRADEFGPGCYVRLSWRLGVCSHDPIQPAPVYMMGADRAIDRYAPGTTGPRPAAGQAGSRYTMSPPSRPTTRSVQPERGSQHTVMANHPTLSHKKAHAGHPAMSHATAARRATASMTPVSAADGDASATVIPLDEPAPERIPASPLVSPPPVERAPSAPAP